MARPGQHPHTTSSELWGPLNSASAGSECHICFVNPMSQGNDFSLLYFFPIFFSGLPSPATALPVAPVGGQRQRTSTGALPKRVTRANPIEARRLTVKINLITSILSIVAHNPHRLRPPTQHLRTNAKRVVRPFFSSAPPRN